MRYLFGLLCVCALSVFLSVGCEVDVGEICLFDPCPNGDGCPACDGVECEDDGNECTVDLCNCETGECGITDPMDGEGCNLDGSAGVCVDGVCGEDLCKGVVCDDGIECTVGTCDYVDGTCDFTSLCFDDNNCTEDICDPLDGLCDFTTLIEDGTECIGPPLGEVGLCEAGVCVTACDSASGGEVQCPVEGREDWFCCPGQDECSEVCDVGAFEVQP